MNLNRAIKTMQRRYNFLASRTEAVNSDNARNWDKQEKAAIETLLTEFGAMEPQPDMNDLRAFRKMEGNVI